MDSLQLDLAPLAPLNSSTETVPGNAEVFTPEKVCPKKIQYVVEDHKLAHLSFVGGCEGNLKAMATLLEGMDIDDVVEKLSGITCGNKPTSCADQLCKALRDHA